MTDIKKKLEQRIGQLEIEQENQEVQLKNLNVVDQKILRLEAILTGTVKAKIQKNHYLHYSQETNRLEHELAKISKNSTTTIQQEKSSKQVPVKKKVTYVIGLMFNTESPSEWSGNGWRKTGRGQYYTTLEEVKQVIQHIQKKWPHYPLKILKR